ncbi:phosphatase PAP2 family protein [Nocardia mexicana]|uniref:Undecaprenyl-diphosphatase n=1 Tax=Nocardia mexicana TaxID=279262 RepID=A0A370HAQ6_9NOCA|nr:phosphatase PAP2 family protein [Nocardia mexicana]RDI53134.1 undecaprenyl-diphosphatase [Nocardia mexicana]
MALLVVTLTIAIVAVVFARRGLLSRAGGGILVAVVALPSIVAELAEGVLNNDGATRIDGPTMDWAVAQRTGTLTPVVHAITDLGDTLSMTTLAVTACAWLAWQRRWSQLVLIATVAVGAGVTVVAVKNVVGRRRPPVDHLVTESSLSFPSGHALSTTAVVGVVAALTVLSLRRRAAKIAVGAIAALFVLAVGASRVYMGVHWPTDVLAGWTLGILWVVVGVTVLRAVRPADAPARTREDEREDVSASAHR